MTQTYLGGRYGVAALLAILPVFSASYGQRTAAADRLDAVTGCRSDPDARTRLACYDRAVADLIGARASDGLVVLDRAQVRERQRAGFGLDGPPVDTATGARLPPINTLDSKVTRLTPTPNGRFLVTLADGSVWRTIENARIEPAGGDTVHVRRGAIGSYLASFNEARSIRVERVR